MDTAERFLSGFALFILLVIVGSIGSCQYNEHTRNIAKIDAVVELVKNGSEPLAARCAVELSSSCETLLAAEAERTRD